jgi:hypothetical protein
LNTNGVLFFYFYSTWNLASFHRRETLSGETGTHLKGRTEWQDVYYEDVREAKLCGFVDSGKRCEGDRKKEEKVREPLEANGLLNKEEDDRCTKREKNCLNRKVATCCKDSILTLSRPYDERNN